METFDDILDAVRVSAASTDPMFARKGRDAAGLTAEIDASDWRDNGVLKTITDPVQRERVAEKMQRGVFERRKAVQEYEVQQLLDWSRAEVGRRIGRNGAEIAADFGRRLDLLTSQWNSPDSVAGRAWLAEQYKDDPNFTMPTVADAPGFAAMVDEFGAVSQKMYGDAFAAYKGVGYSDAEAEAKAAGAMRSAVVGSLQGFAEKGDETRGRFVDSVLGKYGKAESRFVPDDVVDNDGKPMLDKDGNKLVAKDKDGKPMVHFDPAGGLWMDDNDVAKIAAYRQRAFADAQTAAASRRASAEDGMRAEIAACGARGDALLSRDDYNFDAVKLREELNKLDGFVDFAARNGLREVAESAATNARRLRDKAQTMSEKHDTITKKALADAKQVDVTKKFSMFSDACAQFDNDKKEAIILRAIDAGGAANMTGDNSLESNVTPDIVGMSFYMRELSRNVLNLDGLTDDQRRKARDYFERASQESFNTVVSNTQNLLRDIGFHIDADAQTRQILYRGAYQELDDAPSGQGSSRIFLTDAGKAVLGANTVVSWEDPERRIESSRHFGITFTDDKTPRMDGFMKPEMTSIVGSLVDMVNSLGYDLYDGKHEDQKKAIKESLLKTIRTMHGQKSMADLVDAMHESAVRQSIRGSMLPVWDAAEIRKNTK